MIEKIKQWDIDLFIYLNNSGIESLDGFWLFITNTTVWIPLFALLLYLIFKAYETPKAKIVFLYFLGLVALSLLLMALTKFSVARLRPNNLLEISEMIRILKRPGGYSFYSGHASNSFAIATFAYLVLRKKFSWIWLVFLFPFLFALSRIFVGVHFPSDLIFGAFMGCLLAFLFYKRCNTHLNTLV